MKPRRVTQLLMTAGLAVATATACLPFQPQGGDPGAATSSAGAATEQASPSSSAGVTASSTPGAPSAPAAPSSSAEQPTAGGPSGEPSASTSPSDAGSATPSQSSGQGRSDATINGWNIDYFEGFDSSLEDLGWEHYGWGDPPVGHGAMGVMSQKNSFTQNGELVVRTQYQDGQWSAGGASSEHVFTASRGRWEVRAKFPQAKGVGYVFLLWPEDQGWPPEIDFAEGRVNGPRVEGTYHWDPDNKQEQRAFDNVDMSGWHTYGVIVEDDHITFTLDGQEWGRIERSITDKRMFFGVQTGAMDPNGDAKRYETVDGGVPGPLTPTVSDIQIDYVAHYTRG